MSMNKRSQTLLIALINFFAAAMFMVAYAARPNAALIPLAVVFLILGLAAVARWRRLPAP
jgi:hypothetical protein